MGVVKLALSAAEVYASQQRAKLDAAAAAAVVAIDPVYLPNHHIFYVERVADMTDALPKWVSFPEGQLFQASSSSTPTVTLPSVQTVNLERYNVEHGRLRKDVMPMSPTRAQIPDKYWYTENDAPVNHLTEITQDKMEERRQRKYTRSALPLDTSLLGITPHKKYGAIVVGGGHNGLVSAAYLAMHGVKDVLVLERRHLVGGAAVTEEMIPGFKFSRGSYLAGLLRPKVIKDLNLHAYGLKYLPRDPSSFTPSLLKGPNQGKYLLLGSNEHKNWESIAQFNKKDADMYPKYEAFLHQIRELVQPILDYPPMDLISAGNQSQDYFRHLAGLKQLVKVGAKNREVLMPFYELFTAPASHILDRWFESEMLKTTLATDAVIGANISPKHNGSAYVLLHHVMGEAAGKPGVWAYVEGGMGAISDAVAASAKAKGAQIVCNASVKRILHQTGPQGQHKVTGVQLEDGTKLESGTVT
jgi:hypothetical protein